MTGFVSTSSDVLLTVIGRTWLSTKRSSRMDPSSISKQRTKKTSCAPCVGEDHNLVGLLSQSRTLHINNPRHRYKIRGEHPSGGKGTVVTVIDLSI